MKNLLSYFKLLLLPFLNLASFIACFYLSVLFFLILIINEEISGKPNDLLRSDFEAFIQKASDFPESIFTPAQRQEVEWLKKVF